MNKPAARPGTPVPEPAPPAAPGATSPSVLPALRTTTMDPPDPKPKYHLQSELGKSIVVAEIGEKIMNTPNLFSINEFLTILPEMSGSIHEQTHCKRIQVEDASATDSTTEYEAKVQTATIANIYKLYYAIPSGCTVVVLDDKLLMESLLDDGSELNLIAEEVYSELGHLIDENIQWIRLKD